MTLQTNSTIPLVGAPERNHSLTRSRGLRAGSIVAYSALGFILAWSRLTGLGQSYWHDEIVTVVNFVRTGPREILFGNYLTNNHELFSLLAWATSSVVGESEIAVRLGSVIPFIVGVLAVTAWLHVRIGVLAALLFLFFSTLSPQLLDLSRQARGYGVAFLAMSALVVAAAEADRSRRSWAVATFCAAGVAGTWTLPIFGIAFFATGGVLLANPLLRRKMLIGLAAATMAIVAWYVPHADGLLQGSEQRFGDPIPWWGIATAPIDQLLLPAFVGVDGTTLATTLGRIAIVVAASMLLLSSPLLREARTALLLGSGAVATLLVVWMTRLYLLPRFVTFLLVPVLIFLASGTAHVLAGSGTRRLRVRLAVALAALVLVPVVFASTAAQVTRLPREAYSDAAVVIQDQTSPTPPVFAHNMRPGDLAFYLKAPVRAPRASNLASRVCRDQRDVVLVVQPYRVRPIRVPCLRRSGVRHYRLRQYSRGGKIDVWFIPPRS